MSIREGRCYRINQKAGTKRFCCGDSSSVSDRGKEVRALLVYEKVGLVQVLDLKDPSSRFNIQKSSLDPL